MNVAVVWRSLLFDGEYCYLPENVGVDDKYIINLLVFFVSIKSIMVKIFDNFN